MPVLDAKALKSDRKGLAFLRAILTDGRSDDSRKAPDSRLSKRPAAPVQNGVNR